MKHLNCSFLILLKDLPAIYTIDCEDGSAEVLRCSFYCSIYKILLISDSLCFLSLLRSSIEDLAVFCFNWTTRELILGWWALFLVLELSLIYLNECTSSFTSVSSLPPSRPCRKCVSTVSDGGLFYYSIKYVALFSSTLFIELLRISYSWFCYIFYFLMFLPWNFLFLVSLSPWYRYSAEKLIAIKRSFSG